MQVFKSTLFHPCSSALLALLTSLASFSASAHDSWLAPEQHTASAGVELRMDMTSGEHFPVLGSGIDRERIEKSLCRQGQTIFSLNPTQRNTKALRLVVVPPGNGAVTCWVELKPRVLDLAANKIQGYLDEIDAPESIRAAWAAVPAPKRWNETYTKNAKVMVPPAESTPLAQTSGNVPVGLKLELVTSAVESSSGLKGILPVQVLRDGKPLAGLSIALSSELGGSPLRQRSDSQGRVSFSAPAPGRWMLSATDLRPIKADEGKWESQFTTLVFEVRAHTP